MEYRTESDLLGEKKIDNERYYGINTARALENFDLPTQKANLKIYREISLIKKAAAIANNNVGNLGKEKSDAIIRACDDAINGLFDDSDFVVCSIQGGAGTSTNMNVNECIANRAIEFLGGKKGDYHIIHPLNDVNMSQSTNDVYPTAIRIAAIRLIRDLCDTLANFQEILQQKENEFTDIPKLARTQLMDALPMRAGAGFGAYAQAIARDRWRIYKAEERIRHINIGGTAIGTGLNALPKYTYYVTELLQNLTGFGLSRAESPMDITQNADVFVEVSGLLKSCAVNLIKISNDLRLLASGPGGGFGEVILSDVQAGSTIMPGKVNPVMPEMIFQVATKIIANDFSITYAAASGQLELNAFLPLIAENLLESLELLKSSIDLFVDKCIKTISINQHKCLSNLEKSSGYAAGLIHHIGYDKASRIAKESMITGMPIREILENENELPIDVIDKIFRLSEATKPGIPGK